MYINVYNDLLPYAGMQACKHAGMQVGRQIGGQAGTRRQTNSPRLQALASQALVAFRFFHFLLYFLEAEAASARTGTSKPSPARGLRCVGPTNTEVGGRLIALTENMCVFTKLR